MARYIKANPKVAKYLNLEADRNRLSDGNYLMWQNDILPFGRLIDLPAILTQIGAIALAPYEARQEQDGSNVRELPTATDPRFVIETVAETTTEAAAESVAAEDADSAEAEIAAEAEAEAETETATEEKED